MNMIRSLTTPKKKAAATSHVEVGSPVSIAGYRPQTEVDEINAIAYDQRAIEQLLQKGDQSSFEQARHIYVKGGYASPYALVHIQSVGGSGLPFAIEIGQKFTGVSVDGTVITATTFEKYAKGTTTIFLLYDHNEVSTPCHVGGLAEPEYGGCFVNNGELQVVPANNEHADATPAAPLSYIYNYTKDNLNEHTIQGYSIHANGKFRPDGNSRPYMEDFQKYVDYYGMYDYADQIITAAFPLDNKTNTDASSQQPFVFKSGTFDFASFSLNARQEIIQSTTAYMATGMFVIREMEHGVIHCDQKCGEIASNTTTTKNNTIPDCMVHPLHSVDSAVALYTGAVQAQDGNGNLLYGLANEQCRAFKTCWNAKTGHHDYHDGLTAQVNLDIIQQFSELQHHLDASNCVEAKVNKRHVAHKMIVPLVQGLLQSVYDINSKNLNDDQQQQQQVENNDDDVLQARSIAMAAAVLPVLAHCSHGDAAIVYKSVTEDPRVGNLEQFELVKSLLELHYDCMGISCQDVGGLVDPTTGDYISAQTAPCGEPFDKGDDSLDNVKKGAAFGSMFLIFLAGSVLLCCVLYRRRKRRFKRNNDDDDHDDDSLSSIESLSWCTKQSYKGIHTQLQFRSR